MTHKKAVRYFKPRKKTAIKTTFRLMRAGFWRSANFTSRLVYSQNRLGGLSTEAIARDSKFNSVDLTRRWLSSRAADGLNRRGAVSKLKLRCIFVGRGRATSQELFMTRHTFRKFLKIGFMPGFVKYTKL